MRRTICFLLAAMICLSMFPAVRADVIFEPEDSFYWDHRGECQYHDRSYTANGPDNVAVVYRSPESSAVVERVKNGRSLWISYIYEDKHDISWGYCENFEEDWSGWVPMDYLLLIYDHRCFQEEFAGRIENRGGTLPEFDAEVRFWDYPGSEGSVAMAVEGDYLPEYQSTFTDDAGRAWGCVAYYMGVRDVWVCLDDPTADYQTLYADHAPQQVTHPTPPETVPAEIKPGGPDMGGILAAVCVVAILSGGFLWLTRKKK